MILLEIRIHCRAVRIFDVRQLRAAGDKDLRWNGLRMSQHEIGEGDWAQVPSPSLWEIVDAASLLNKKHTATQAIAGGAQLFLQAVQTCSHKPRAAATATAEAF